ncbi:Uncharacterized conserved protein, DUF2252 family [Catalinimonas alkaloidigena]|uniref:Uncharacterized conserved protein, DUF2252 family n=1 Tax=Catalinimonas alkaloidigena TaxID=1075417 RepID=A0A1G9A885_9BACT|nr:DUF2252 family protein [Catalinimonas alkaloidigena]SDK23517.1 Uncharacterized conserved protein, DUF2252 family [Catalinimonas alkaloidigena]
MLIIKPTHSFNPERWDQFRQYAHSCAQNAVHFSPSLLPTWERRLHIRQTLREDHQFRIHNRPEGAQAKFDKLATSPFIFFRGTALLYYRDYAGMDAHLPYVFTIGDVHPENFGVMPNENGAPIFGVNDFDEAFVAPFSWDVKRGATGFFLAARGNGFSKKKARKIVRAFVNGYLAGLQSFAQDDREKWHQYRIDNSPPMIRKLLKKSISDRTKFLSKWVDLDKGEFLPSEEIVPWSKHVQKFQRIINKYKKENNIGNGARGGHFQVKDVALKKDSGTASLGLDRYLVLIDGETEDNGDDIMLELKQARRSALYGLVPPHAEDKDEQASRIVSAHTVQLAGGDAYYGCVEFDKQSYVVQERSPFKDEIDIEKLDHDDFREYADICGKTLSISHARSDEDTGMMEGNAEAKILSSLTPQVFCADTVEFAEAAAKRVTQDYKLFLEDHARGAYQIIHEGA